MRVIWKVMRSLNLDFIIVLLILIQFDAQWDSCHIVWINLERTCFVHEIYLDTQVMVLIEYSFIEGQIQCVN